MADPMLVKSLFGAGGAVMAVVLLTYAKGAFKSSASAAIEAQGHEVFRGEAAVARQALDELASAGVAAWLESHDQELALMVDEDQVEQLPQLLALQQHLRQQQAAEGDQPGRAG